MKKNFFTGLAILFPIAITFFLVNFFINLLTKPFLGFVNDIFIRYGWSEGSFFFINHSDLILVISKLLILVVLILATIAIGILGRVYVISHFFQVIDFLAHRIPGFNRIYRSFQEAVKTLFASKNAAFSSVVFAPFPGLNTYSIGFITGEQTYTNIEHQNTISVFVPGTPNPTQGFMLLFHKEQLIFVDMSVEEALKYVVSCGVIAPEIKIIPPPTKSQDISTE